MQYRKWKKKLITIGCLSALSGCSTTSKVPIVSAEAYITPASVTQSYQVMSERVLRSDGVDTGKEAYDLIRDFAGPRSIESPDLYHNNHPGKPHIYEATDGIVGDHFVFTIHKNHDKDRGISTITDRQRNEIKGYSGSDSILRAYKNELATYRWKFKLNEGLTLSRNFGHFFQLKAVDDGPGAPILTISGRDRNGEWLEVIHRIHGKTDYLAKVPLGSLKGKWLEVNMFVNYSNNGQLELNITEVVSQKTVVNLSLDEIDMLRGEANRHFVRPKWGIYRSLKSKEMLREDEEQVFFADFSVQKLRVAQSD